MAKTYSLLESLDRDDAIISESITGAIKDFWGTSRFTNKEVKKITDIVKAIKKQLWAKLALYRKRKAVEANSEGREVASINEDFFKGFLKTIQADSDISTYVLKVHGKSINILNDIFKDYESGKMNVNSLKTLLNKSNVDINSLIASFISLLAMETTSKYLESSTDIDLPDTKPGAVRKGLSKLVKASSSTAKSISKGIADASEERMKKM